MPEDFLAYYPESEYYPSQEDTYEGLRIVRKYDVGLGHSQPLTLDSKLTKDQLKTLRKGRPSLN